MISLINPVMLSISTMRLSSRCTLDDDRATTSRIDWVPACTAWYCARARLTTSSMACFICSALTEACCSSPSCSSMMIIIWCTASATSAELTLASWLRPSIIWLVLPTVRLALTTCPTTVSRRSMKLLIQRAMSPLSSLAKVLVSRRWRRLPSPSAMVHSTLLMPFNLAARRLGPSMPNNKVAPSMLKASIASVSPCGRPA
ncbi:hypothetical protein D9M71_294490 [compost metagenome]